MHLKSVKIKNFRLLEDIDATFDKKVNVIVGPNASGKTTILDAIRLAKAVLAPRTSGETNQVLFSLGAGSPHLPQQFIVGALARDAAKVVEIRTTYELNDTEIEFLTTSAEEIAVNLIQTQMGQAFANAAARIAFLSSQMGQQALNNAKTALEPALSAIRATRICPINLIIDPSTRQMTTDNQLSPILFSQIEQHHRPHESIFTYFPADRAMPLGEQPVQLGAQDASAQLESYNSQPQLKYQRLKNTIFSAVILNAQGRESLEADFHDIFSHVLKGRRLVGFGTNQVGMLSIQVQDTETSHTFDLDGMSSGEKGLILTCLLIARSAAQGSVVLLDEPELHLNPAVCKDLLAFFVDTYVRRKGIQLITCSHSPEILMGAFDRDECAVHHLESSTKLSKVRRKDEDVVSEALRRLGSSEIDGLLYKATVFVEGEDDIELLHAGFDEMLRKFKLNDRGGRREIEKLISAIQNSEKAGRTPQRQFFILDRDDEPCALTTSDSARILQWNRRCIENYLIDIDVVTDMLKSSDIARDTSIISGPTDTIRILKGLALDQLNEFVAKKVYSTYNFISPEARRSDLQGKTITHIGKNLFERLSLISGQLSALSEDKWVAGFIEECERTKTKLDPIWQEKWAEFCDGKRLFSDLQRRIQLKVGMRHFKCRVMAEMRHAKSPLWVEMSSMLATLLT